MHVSKERDRMVRKVLSVFALLLITGSMWAQNIKVTGIVKDNKGEAQIGVAVVIEGTRTGVSTDANGAYEITAPSKGTLVFSAIGMKKLSIPINGKTQINAVMELDNVLLDELVVVGWGTQKKENLSGAVSSVNVTKTLQSRPISDVGRALQGSTPGLSITTTSGALGGDPTIRIRSNYASLGQGSAAPVILLDNVEVPSLSYVNPNDIESITTLKDASSTAIYGARAANGAILITTKKGSKDGKTTVSYSSNFSWATKTKVPVTSRPDLELDYSWKQRNGLALGLGNTPTNEFGQIGPVYYNPEMIVKVKAYYDQYGLGKGLDREMVEGRDFEKRPAGGFYFYRGWDLENMYYRKWAPQQTHNISVAGGTDKVKYNMSAGLLDQQGILQLFDDKYQRLNTSGNLSVNVNKYITLRSNFIFTKLRQDTPFSFTGSTYEPIYYMYRWFAIYPEGTYKGYETRSPAAEMAASRKNPSIAESWYTRISLGSTLNLAKGLTANFDYIYNLTAISSKASGGYVTGINTFNTYPAGKDLDYWYQTYTSSSYDYVQMATSRKMRNTYNANIQYEKSFGKHNTKLIVGTNIEDEEYVYESSKRMGVIDYNFPELNLAIGDQTVGSGHTDWSVLGFFSRLNYDYDNKYLLELNFRRDATSKFRDGMRWGSYPSGSAAWRLSEEPFWTAVKPYVNSFKIRGSYGMIGNQDVPSSLYYPTIGVTNPAATGNYWLRSANFVPYVSSAPGLINPDLTWESISTLDIGIDARFFKDKFGLTVDWYNKKTTNAITAGEVIPSSIGASAPQRNFGEVSTKGIEIELNFNHIFSNGLEINLSGQYTDYKSIVQKYPTAADPLYSATYYNGKVLGSIWGYKVERLFQKEDFVYGTDGKIQTQLLANGKTVNVFANLDPAYQELYQSGNFRFSPGDLKFKDLNGDGIINYGTNTLSNLGDRTIIGNTQPRHQFGFRVGANWKGFDFDIFFQGVGSRSLWATGNMVLPGFTGSESNFSHTLDYWTEENTDAFYPRPLDYGQYSQWNYQVSDRYLLNLSYLRCKTLNIGYTLPKKVTQKIMIEKLRVYFSGENLFEWDNMGGVAIDPELDWTTQTSADGRSFGRSYPYRRTLSFGVQLDF
jgi:TonB-linked SusC/RagA family outer membrane protein